MTQLLVSVRSAEEARAALAGGADLIDIKEPARGSLGRADESTIAEVLRVAGRAPVSAALGELGDQPAGPLPAVVARLAFVKWGLAGEGRADRACGWTARLRALGRELHELNPGACLVTVAYADWERAAAPSPEDVCEYVCASGRVLLLDTWGKDGSTLLDWAPPKTIDHIIQSLRAAGVRVALAGSLGLDEVRALLPLAPDWFAVRGAVCHGRDRSAAIDEGRVRQLVRFLGTRSA
jgi:uncharacterized protein (UPF0264 family)